jgi:hypothetical protein
MGLSCVFVRKKRLWDSTELQSMLVEDQNALF